MASDRENDEQTLRILDLRAQGLTYAEIAVSTGLTERAVNQRARRAIAEDCTHDPEAATYWAASGNVAARRDGQIPTKTEA